jgi:hypothetical protein
MWRPGKRPAQSEATPAGKRPASWTWGPADAAIAAGLAVVAMAICLPVSFHFHARSTELEKELDAARARARSIRVTLDHVESRRVDLSRLRREVNRYVAEVEARPIVAWTTVVGELSRRRPDGLWTSRVSGSGPRFRAQVSAATPELAGIYARQLRESPYVDFAALPAGEGPSVSTQVVGRLMGE